METKPGNRPTEPWTTAAPDLEVTAQHALLERQRMISVLAKSNTVAQASNLEELFTRFLDLLIETAGAESSILYLFDPRTDELVFTSVRGDDESQGMIGLRLKKHLWLVDPVNPRSRVIIVGDIVGDPALLRIINPTKAGSLVNTVVIPLFLREKTFGLIQIFNYTQCELDLLEALADRFVIEADRLMTLESTEHSNQRLKLLIDMISAVSGTLDRTQLLQTVPEQAARLTEAERSSLFLVDSSNNELGFHASYQLPPEPESPEPSDSRRQQFRKIIAGVQAARSGPVRPVTASANLNNLSPLPTPAGFGFATRSAITVPLHESKLDPGKRQDGPASTVGGLTVLKMRGESFDEEDVQLLETLAHQASIFLQAAEVYENINDLFLDAIKALVAAIDAKDRYTQGHSMRVLEYALAIASEIGLDANTISDIRIGSLLHDVGKIGVSDQILGKPGLLTQKEYKVMKKHPLYGRQIMSQVRVLQSALPGIAEHHERLDGSGYPYGLVGDQISVAGRVIAVADVFDAMTTTRPYRKAIPIQVTVNYLLAEGGKLFDRECVQAISRIAERNMLGYEEQDGIERNGDDAEHRRSLRTSTQEDKKVLYKYSDW